MVLGVDLSLLLFPLLLFVVNFGVLALVWVGVSRLRYRAAPQRLILWSAIAAGLTGGSFTALVAMIAGGLPTVIERFAALTLVLVFAAAVADQQLLTAELKPYASHEPPTDDWGARMDADVKGRAGG